ncbi:MAG: hypothetical protein ACI9TH_002825 [Kiritimatiellia bacterium]|jgi:hypothetical protein
MRPHAWRLDQAGLVKTHKHLFEEICSFENLLAAAQAAMRGKRSRPPAAAFFARIETELIALQEELLAGTYRPGCKKMSTQSKYPTVFDATRWTLREPIFGYRAASRG